MAQNNVRSGRFVVNAAEDLTGMEDRLVELTYSGSTPEVRLPTSNTARGLYVLIEGGEADTNVTVEPLNPDREVRLVAKGTGNPGDSVCLADVATAADKGKVRALPAAAATYRVFGILKAACADGDLALVSPNGPESVTVT